MTEQQQACAELARMIGWREGELAGIWFPPDGNLERVQTDPPDYFTDPAASRELVAWLAVENQWREQEAFMNYFIKAMRIERAWIEGYSGPLFSKSDIFAALTADLPVIARAACKALGIEVEE